MPWEGVERRNIDAATRLGQWLLSRAELFAISIIMVYMILGILAIGIIQTNRRSKIQLVRIEALIEQTKAQAEFNETLSAALREFEVKHAQATAASHEAINTNLRCILLIRPEDRTPENVNACLQETVPAPKPLPIPPPPNDPTRQKNGSAKR